MTPLLELKDIRKYYATQKAVDGISFTIDKGSIFGLLGPNGAGKTTLLRMITGIFFADSGSILLEGKTFRPDEDVSQIGYMPEERGLYRKMKIGEQAIYLAQLKGLSQKEAFEQARFWFGRLEMQSWWNKKVEDLSKGMGQKLQFVITVMHRPPLIILDEPFSGLDPVNANLIKEEIFRLKEEGSTIIFSTHRMEQVEEICDHILLINRGQKLLDGSVPAVKQQYKEHLFEVTVANATPATMQSPAFSTVSSSGHTYIVKLQSNHGSNEVLQHLLQQGLVIQSFREVLPSLNDIFIRIVEGSPATRQFQFNS